MRHLIAGAIVCLAVCCDSLAADPADRLEAKKEAFQKELSRRDFRFTERQSGVMWSLRQSRGDFLIHVIYNPKDRFRLTFKFERDGKEVLSVEGHIESSFFVRKNVLYFAHFSPGTFGCTVASYDLNAGKMLWTTKLTAANPVAHSAYRNQVEIGWGHDETIEIIGRESLNAYIEILDMSTGNVLAQRSYR